MPTGRRIRRFLATGLARYPIVGYSHTGKAKREKESHTMTSRRITSPVTRSASRDMLAPTHAEIAAKRQADRDECADLIDHVFNVIDTRDGSIHSTHADERDATYAARTNSFSGGGYRVEKFAASCACTADHYCASCSAADAAMEAASGMTNCWVCDALAPAITDETGRVIGTRCGCDDHPYADGSDGIWR